MRLKILDEGIKTIKKFVYKKSIDLFLSDNWISKWLSQKFISLLCNKRYVYVKFRGKWNETCCSKRKLRYIIYLKKLNPKYALSIQPSPNSHSLTQEVVSSLLCLLLLLCPLLTNVTNTASSFCCRNYHHCRMFLLLPPPAALIAISCCPSFPCLGFCNQRTSYCNCCCLCNTLSLPILLTPLHHSTIFLHIGELPRRTTLFLSI